MKPGVRPGEEDDPLPILYWETEQNTYSMLEAEGALSMKDLSKHFKNEIKTVSTENFLQK